MNDRIEEEMLALLPQLRKFAYALTGAWPDADDLVQATCIRAIERIDQWEVGTRLDSWMYRIAQNLHLNAIRKDRHRASHLREIASADQAGVAPDRPEDRLMLQDLGDAIGRLPSEQRAILLLITVEGRSYQEVSDLMGLSPGTVASRLSRARTTLAAMLEGEK